MAICLMKRSNEVSIVVIILITILRSRNNEDDELVGSNYLSHLLCNNKILIPILTTIDYLYIIIYYIVIFCFAFVFPGQCTWIVLIHVRS